MEFWRTKRFKELSKEWNQKLIESGFVEIEFENKNGSRSLIRTRANRRFQRSDPISREAILNYFLAVSHRVNSESFPSEVDSMVMIRHSEGATIKEIVDELALNGIRKDRKIIRFIIRRYQMKWGIKDWSREPMIFRKIVIK